MSQGLRKAIDGGSGSGVGGGGGGSSGHTDAGAGQKGSSTSTPSKDEEKISSAADTMQKLTILSLVESRASILVNASASLVQVNAVLIAIYTVLIFGDPSKWQTAGLATVGLVCSLLGLAFLMTLSRVRGVSFKPAAEVGNVIAEREKYVLRCASRQQKGWWLTVLSFACIAGILGNQLFHSSLLSHIDIDHLPWPGARK